MGNSNIGDAGEAQSEGSSDSIQLYYHSKLYGKHKLTAAPCAVQKTYIISSEMENLQFQSLASSYQQLSHSSLLRMLSIDMEPLSPHLGPLNGQQSIKYLIHYQYCPSNLNAEIYLRRSQPYRGEQILDMLQQTTQALLLLAKERFPCGVLTPQKIAVGLKPAPELGQSTRYCLTLDLLMNGQQYRNLQILQEDSTKKYLSPEQQSGNKTHLGSNSSWDHTQALVYSLGLIALKMAYHEDVPSKQAKLQAFRLRDKFAYQLAALVSAMLQEVPASRISLEDLKEEIGFLKRTATELQGSRRVLKRGYDSLQSAHFFDQTPISTKTKLRRSEKAQRLQAT